MVSVFNSQKVISLNVSIGKYSDFLLDIMIRSRAKKSSYVCVANVHMCIEAQDDQSFAQLVNNADLITPDGMPLAKAIEVLCGEHQERVAGMDLLPDLLEEAERQRLSCFIYGGSEAVLEKSQDYISAKYPTLRCGFYSPPFRPLTSEEEQADCERINEFGAHLVFVVLGCPKQEKWMARMKGRIHACMIGVGGALPVMIGMQKRAPDWMQQVSLEWLYRLIQEPKRLFKRYAYTNTKFLYLLCKQKLGILK